jgi:hypothetical protein
MRYAGLEDIQRSSREREMQIRRTATRPGDSQGAIDMVDTATKTRCFTLAKQL